MFLILWGIGLAIVENNTKPIAAPKTINRINQNEVAMIARPNPEFKINNHKATKHRASISKQRSRLIGQARWKTMVFKILTRDKNKRNLIIITLFRFTVISSSNSLYFFLTKIRDFSIK